MLQLKGRPSPKKPVFFINCGIHAREWVSPATCMYMIKQVCDCLKLVFDWAITSLKPVIDFQFQF